MEKTIINVTVESESFVNDNAGSTPIDSKIFDFEEKPHFIFFIGRSDLESLSESDKQVIDTIK